MIIIHVIDILRIVTIIASIMIASTIRITAIMISINIINTISITIPGIDMRMTTDILSLWPLSSF